MTNRLRLVLRLSDQNLNRFLLLEKIKPLAVGLGASEVRGRSLLYKDRDMIVGDRR